ncbi:MAG TPA: TetR/AcrR family transcriptional regulator, partial [Leptospiraceae bacterium]|nr:TetR/AcrR family transcriptional regulator [Leptospiraceae bacterium]
MKTSGPKTKEALIQSALTLFEKKGISNVSVDTITKAANVAKGSFYTHFKNRADFLIYLHRDFHEKLKLEITKGIQNQPFGMERLWIGTETYLNYCLSNSSMKSFLFEARIEPALTKEVSNRNREFSI